MAKLRLASPLMGRMPPRRRRATAPSGGGAIARGRTKQTRSLAVLSWLVAAAAAAAALGLAVAPEFLTEGGAPSLFRTGSVRSLLSRPVLSGGVFVMELICRLMVMMLALLLRCAPKHRDAVLQRVRRVLKHEVDKMALSMQTALDQERPGVTLTPDGAPPHAVVVGAPGVRKSALIGALREVARERGVELCVAEGLPAAGADCAEVRLGVIVWEAALEASLSHYVHKYNAQLQSAVPAGRRPLRTFVVCNKTDLMPCPLPQLAGRRRAPSRPPPARNRGPRPLLHPFPLLRPRHRRPPPRPRAPAAVLTSSLSPHPRPRPPRGLDEAIASTAFVALSVERGINVRALWEMPPLLLPDDEAGAPTPTPPAPPPARPRRAARQPPVPPRRAAPARRRRDSDADIAGEGSRPPCLEIRASRDRARELKSLTRALEMNRQGWACISQSGGAASGDGGWMAGLSF